MKSGNYYILCTVRRKTNQNNLQPFNQRYLKMETIFMNTENRKTNEPHRFRLLLADKRNLKNPNKNIALGNLSIYSTWKNIRSAYNSNKFKISTPTSNDTFDLSDGSYSIADIHDYFEIIIKKHETLTENPPVQIYPNKIKNRIVFKTKTGYKLELLSSETMKLLGGTKKDVDQDKDGQDIPKLESVEVVLVHCNLVTMKLLGGTKKDVDQDKDGQDIPKLESVEVVLVHCNLVNKNYQQTSKVLFTFVPNRQCGQLINVSPHSLTMLGTTSTELSFIEVWFTDQNSEPLEIEDFKTLIIGLTL